jgi:hypothetical protein
MLFGEGPAFWPLFVGAWALALVFWGALISGRRRARAVSGAANTNMSAVEHEPQIAA